MHSKHSPLRSLGNPILACAALVLALSGCKSDSGGGSTGLECDAVAAMLASAPPLARVELTGLDGADEAEHWVRVVVKGFDSYPTALYGTAPGEYEVLVPLHPDGVGGGELELVVTDGSHSCPAIAFEVLSLPSPAGDPARELFAALADVADALADQRDVDPDDLFDTPLDELPPDLVPLALLFELLDAVDLEAELAGLTPDELELLQGLLGVLGAAEPHDELADLIEALPPTRPAVPAPARAVARGASSAGGVPLDLTGLSAREIARRTQQQVAAAMAPSAAEGVTCEDLGAVDVGRFDVSTPDELADYLRVARGAADGIGPLRDTVSDLNGGFLALGLTPGGGAASAAVRTLWGLFRIGSELIQQMRASLYPSAITRLTFEVDESEIPEDWDIASDGDIEWSFAKLYATNDGMQIAHVVDFLPEITTSPGAAGFYNAADRSGVPDVDALGGAAVEDRLDELQDGPVLRECWSIPPTEFGPAVVPDDSGEKWVTAKIVSGESVTVDDRKITPVQTGASTIHVETNTAELPGPRGFGDEQVEVKQKLVQWVPNILRVEEVGEPQQVQVRFDNTKHFEPSDVAFEPDDGIAGFTPIPSGGGIYEVYFTPPDDPDAYPLEIIARSTSKQLGPDESPREGKLRIVTDDEVKIAPRGACVPFGEPQDLTAELSSATPGTTVEWDIVSGAGRLIVPGSTGELVSYVAPDSGSGEVVIRASLSSDSEIFDEVTLRHGNCVDIGVFYDIAGQIGLPGTVPGCDGFEQGPQFELSNDEEGEGKDTETPLTPGQKWGPLETFSTDEFRESAGVRGSGIVDDCEAGVFPASVHNQSTVRVTEAGDTVEYDIVLDGTATCDDWSGDDGEDCSSAQSVTVFWVVWELDVAAAGEYRAEVDLVCAANPTQTFGLGNVTMGFQRYTQAGEAVLTNRDFAKAIFLRTGACLPGEAPVRIDALFEVDEPIAAGTTDRLVVYLATPIGAFASPGSNAAEVAHATMNGFARVRKVGGE